MHIGDEEILSDDSKNKIITDGALVDVKNIAKDKNLNAIAYLLRVKL